MASLDTLSAEIEKFMVPYAVPGPPTESDPPELGWPNGDEPPPMPLEDTSPSDSLDNASIKTNSTTPGEYAGGYIAAPPYWDGASIVNNTADTVTVATPAQHPDGEQVDQVTAVTDDQVDFELAGAPAVNNFSQVKRVSDELLIAVNNASGYHNPSIGRFSIHNPTPPILENDILDVTWFKEYSGIIPSGTNYKLAKPHTPTAPFTIGDAWAGAFEQFVYQGTPVPAPGSLAGAKSAMKGILDAMTIPGMFPAAISLGVLTFWGTVAGSAAVIWASLGAVTSFIPPPGAFAMGGAIIGAGAACLALGPGDGLTYSTWELQLPKDCAMAIASAVHGASQGGQIMTQNGPTPVPVAFVLS